MQFYEIHAKNVKLCSSIRVKSLFFDDSILHSSHNIHLPYMWSSTLAHATVLTGSRSCKLIGF